MSAVSAEGAGTADPGGGQPLNDLVRRRTGWQEAAKKTAGRGQGWPGGREEVAGTGTEQTRFHSGKQGVAISCDAKCDAISADRIELLARAVVFVAGMGIPVAARVAVLARLTADRASQNGSPTEL